MFLVTTLIFLAAAALGSAAPALHPTVCSTTPAPSQCRTVCAFSNTDLSTLTGHIAGTMLFYEGTLNGTVASPLVWNLNLIQTSPNRATNVFSPFEVVQAWDRDRFKKVCDVLIGSGHADLDISLVGSIDVPWLEPVVALPPLTNRVEFPNILNGIPLLSETAHTYVSGFGKVEAWSVLSDDSTTSRAWLKAVKSDDNFKLSVLREVAEDTSAVGITNAVADVLAARSRFALIFVSISSPRYAEVMAALTAQHQPNEKVFLFNNEVCDTGNISHFIGSFCVHFKIVSADPASLTLPDVHRYGQYGPYITANSANIWTSHTSVGFTSPQKFADPRTHAAELFHDSVLHYMLVANKDPTQVPSREALRTNVSAGALGMLSYNSNGVRPTITMRMMNVLANGSKVVVAEANTGATSWTELSKAYMIGSEFSLASPPNTYPPVPESPASKTILIIGLVAGGVVLLIVALAVAFFVHSLLAPNARNNSAAPKDDTKPFAVAFTDIQASTALWAAAPQAMSGAVEQHHELIRSLISKHKGYEVKTIGDSFMVAFSSAAKAVVFSQDLQKLFYNTAWPAEIDRGYIGQASDAGLGEGATNPECWNGIRVRVGIHYDTGRITLDPVTKGYDYYGTVTNTAARVETIGNGGQVLLTAAALEAAESESPGVTAPFVVTDLGQENLRGLSEATQLYQIVPKEFEMREFPPLRVDRLENEEFEDLEDDTAKSADPDNSPRSKSFLSDNNKTKASTTPSSHDSTEGAYTAFMEVLLSPLPDTEKGTVLAFFVQRWHVAATTKASTLASNSAVAAKALRGVSQRAGKAHQCLLQGNEADMTRSSTAPRSAARLSSVRHSQALPNPFLDGRKSGAGAGLMHRSEVEQKGSGYLLQQPKLSVTGPSDGMSVHSVQAY